MENHWIEDWLSSCVEKEKNRKQYLSNFKVFSDFAEERGLDIQSIVEEYRKAKYAGYRDVQMFLDKWNDLINGYATNLKNKTNQRGSRHTPLSQKTMLSVPKSFFSYYKIPLDVKLPRYSHLIYHNRDLTKEIVRKILSKATQRDRAIYITMAESGLRGDTVVNLKYWQIKEDYEKDTVPMRILTPASQIKYHVGDRWSFIGEDGFKTLKEYLESRMPLKEQDYVFASKKPTHVKGEQFSEASISTLFKRIVHELKLENSSPYGQPGHYRLHGLRKYFFNNMVSPKEYRDFWMGHKIHSSDEHYITLDPEKHRKVYAQGYEQLRILEPATPTQLIEIADKLKQKDQEIQELRAQNEKLSARIDQLAEPLKLLKELDSVGKEIEKEIEADPDLEKTPLGLIIRYIQLKTAQDLHDDVRKLKEPKKKHVQDELKKERE